MYGGMGGGAGTVLASATTVGGGALLLPETSGNPLATILAYCAISVGVMALTSQVAVRIARKFYS